MAKSSRSKWKKAHRRQKANEESGNVLKRLRNLNKKLKITAKGGISAILSQAPESRFHFLNPELDPRVPNTSKNLNNNYRAELNHVSYDYTKPLKLAAPKTAFHGKSDPTTPHPMTVAYETIDAMAPVAGRALTKADMEHINSKQAELLALAGRLEGNEEGAGASSSSRGRDNSFKLASRAANKNRKGSNNARKKGNENEEDAVISFDNDAALYGDDDGPEEFVLGFGDAKPRRVNKQKQSTSASDDDDEKEEVWDNKIPSMSTQTTLNSRVVATAGNKKVKKMTKESVKTSRMVSSTAKKTHKRVVL